MVVTYGESREGVAEGREGASGCFQSPHPSGRWPQDALASGNTLL